MDSAKNFHCEGFFYFSPGLVTAKLCQKRWREKVITSILITHKKKLESIHFKLRNINFFFKQLTGISFSNELLHRKKGDVCFMLFQGKLFYRKSHLREQS